MPKATLSALTEEQIARYHADGYLIVRGLFSPAEVDEIRETFTELGANGPVKGLSHEVKALTPDDPLARFPRMMQPHRHPEYPVGPLALRAMLDRRIEGILRDLFGEEPLAAQSMFYFKPPGARGQDLHQDNFYLRVKPGTCMAAWMAVDDADQVNGGMVAVPGSHKNDIVCPKPADPALFFTTEHVDVPSGLREIPVDLKAGDVFFFNGAVIHGSYPNTSKDRFRRALIFHYVPMGSVEVSHWYHPLLNFNGEKVAMADATGGGPCGELQATVKGPH